MEHIINSIKKLSAAHFADNVRNRRHLHQHPELSFQEVDTGQFIFEALINMGITQLARCADNGVVALIKGDKGPGKTIALRADMDALPIQEANDVPYKSQNNGVMHACGHDVHTASLLGAARILHQVRQAFAGSIKLIFQPGEELLPGGASVMIKEGVLENPTPASILGQHVHPPLQAGKVGFRGGAYMASADELYMTVTGKGGHGAMPQNGVDPILITAHIVTALQQVVSRNADPTVPTVLTFGKINSTGGATNIIPNEVKLMGTFRTMNESWRFDAHQKMRKIANGIAASMGGTCELDIVVGYPVLYNNEQVTARVKDFAEAYLGPENVVELPIRLTAEDFAYYSQKVPACFYRLGTGNVEKGIISPVHTDTFDIDETSLEVSTGLMAWLALKELEN